MEWGSPIRAEAIDAKLATGEFDALTLIHNETSTGDDEPAGGNRRAEEKISRT